MINPCAFHVPPALDSQGLPHRLKNDSDCGTWVIDSPDGFLVLEATYTGCYVTLEVSRPRPEETQGSLFTLSQADCAAHLFRAPTMS